LPLNICARSATDDFSGGRFDVEMVGVRSVVVVVVAVAGLVVSCGGGRLTVLVVELAGAALWVELGVGVEPVELALEEEETVCKPDAPIEGEVERRPEGGELAAGIGDWMAMLSVTCGNVEVLAGEEERVGGAVKVLQLLVVVFVVVVVGTAVMVVLVENVSFSAWLRDSSNLSLVSSNLFLT